jgi:A/G-specific adenine glycosylase
MNLDLEIKKNQFAEQLIEWYTTHGRDFPWRTTKNPYHILLAEMLLRRTTATAVARVYPNFILRFENPGILVKTRISTIEKQVASLGLQKQRALHLKQTATTLVTDYEGRVPRDHLSLSRLSGVGRYVASAVMNFAFDGSFPLVDGNVLHLLSRVFDLSFDSPTDENAWQFMESFGPDIQHSIFYWSIIDLVAMVCIRSSPRCSECPLRLLCSWNRRNETQNGPT